MSRIGKLPVNLPKTVKASINDGVITVEGPKGKLTQSICEGISVEVGEENIIVSRANDEKAVRAAHGLMRQLINNMVIGVSEGYKKTLVIIGVGYKAELKKDFVLFELGYSDQIEYMIPQGISIKAETPTKLIIEGIDKQLVGQTAAEIRSLRKPEPYKGKGVRYEGEYVRAKSGKAGRA